jgi:hypothetical protein
MKHAFTILATLVLIAGAPLFAEPSTCKAVGGVLMTNVNAIDETYNLGPVFGDLRGSVAAKIISQNAGGTFTLQHYWITDTGDTVHFKPAVLKPASTGDPNVVAVLWGNYKSEISGGTGMYTDATGELEYFGTADFKELTLVLRYRGQLCTTATKGKSEASVKK